MHAPEILGQSASTKRATARAFWTIAPKFCELRDESLAPLGHEEARVRTLVSGISGGTEALVFAGKVPPSEYERMRAPFQSGRFPFPVKYGYAAVGVVEDGPADWRGARVFVLHPHQDLFQVPVSAMTRISNDVPAERAVLSANMETALNAVWDAGVMPGERIAIIGAGVVGSLIAAIVSRIAGVQLTILDTEASRATRAHAFGSRFVLLPASDAGAMGNADFDCVFHTSGHGAGLVTALEIAGVEGRIVDLSWYGTATVTLPLGQSFHSRRLRIISSQVGMIASTQRARFNFARRMAVVQHLLEDVRLDALIGRAVAFAELPAKMGGVLAQRDGSCPLVRYSI